MIETKTVSEMARMCGLSRARFYQLQRIGIFPPPLYDVATRRPIYDESLQKVCLEVRRRNCGVNGRPILFYARRVSISQTSRPKKVANKTPRNDQHTGLVEALQSLGLVVTMTQVGETVKQLYPMGTGGVDESTLIRTVFLHLKRQN